MPMNMQSVYILGRKGRWYRMKSPGKPSRYILVSYLYPESIEFYQRQPQTQGGPTGGGSHSTQVGPRGGVYYINKNGNKTYIKHK